MEHTQKIFNFSIIVILLFLIGCNGEEPTVTADSLPVPSGESNSNSDYQDVDFENETGGLIVVNSDWVQFDVIPTDRKNITGLVIAADGDRLMTYFCRKSPSTNLDYSELFKWNGQSWKSVSHLKNLECHNPHLDIDDNSYAAISNDNSGELHVATNINGVPQASKKLHSWDWNFWNPSGLIIGKKIFLGFTQQNDMWSEAAHIDCDYGCYENGSKVRSYSGGWPHGSVQLGSVVMTEWNGQPLGAFVSRNSGNSCVDVVHVKKYLDYLGVGPENNCFSFGQGPSGLDLITYNGDPVISFLEDGGKKAYILRWDGNTWNTISAFSTAPNETIRKMEIVEEDGDIYIMIKSNTNFELWKFDGAETEFISYVPANGSTVQEHLAVMSGNPVVSFKDSTGYRILGFGF
jgi:hypothetical protein